MSHRKSECILTAIVAMVLIGICLFISCFFSGCSYRPSPDYEPEPIIDSVETEEYESIELKETPAMKAVNTPMARTVSVQNYSVARNDVADVPSEPAAIVEPVEVEPEAPVETEMPVEVVSEAAIETDEFDRTKPLYEVYKGGFLVEVDTDLQWYIRDMCETYNFYEKYVYGMILTESTFHTDAKSEGCYGLCQINSFWIKGANITHFTEDYRDRNLLDPYDNLLTLSEMWCYARDAYNLDLMTEDGMMRVCYWHNTGKDPRYINSSSYFNYAAQYGNELVPLQ